MEVLLLTIFLSLLLVAGFVAFYCADQRRERRSSAEHQALLPLQDDSQEPPDSIKQNSKD